MFSRLYTVVLYCTCPYIQYLPLCTVPSLTYCTFPYVQFLPLCTLPALMYCTFPDVLYLPLRTVPALTPVPALMCCACLTYLSSYLSFPNCLYILDSSTNCLRPPPGTFPPTLFLVYLSLLKFAI